MLLSVVLWKSTRLRGYSAGFWPLGHSYPAGIPALGKNYGINPLHITLRCHQAGHPEAWPGTWSLLIKVPILDVSWMKLTADTHLKFPHQTICSQRMGIINLEERRVVKRSLVLSGRLWARPSSSRPPLPECWWSHPSVRKGLCGHCRKTTVKTKRKCSNISRSGLRFGAYDTKILRTLPQNTTHKPQIRFNHVSTSQGLRKVPES